MVGENYVWTSRLIQTSCILSCTIAETVDTSKIMKLIWKWLNTTHFWQNEFISWATLTYSTSGALYWMKQLFINKTNSIKNGRFLLMSIFRLYPGFRMLFEDNNVRKNLFLGACFCWDPRLSLFELDQKFNFGGTISYGNSCLEFFFRHFKKFRLHAILYDAAGAVRAHSGKGPGYCNMMGGVPNSCFHVRLVTWLDYSLPLRKTLSVLLTFEAVCLALYQILSWQIKTLSKNGSFYWWQSSGLLILSSKKAQTHKTSLLVQKKLARKCVEQWPVGLQWAFKHSS